MTWPESFFNGANGAISSLNPKKKIIISAAMMKRCCDSKYGAAQIVNVKIEAAKIAIPPNNGILSLCIFLSLGSSNNESRLAILMMDGIEANATRKDVRKQRKKLNITSNVVISKIKIIIFQVCSYSKINHRGFLF